MSYLFYINLRNALWRKRSVHVHPSPSVAKPCYAINYLQWKNRQCSTLYGGRKGDHEKQKGWTSTCVSVRTRWHWRPSYVQNWTKFILLSATYSLFTGRSTASDCGRETLSTAARTRRLEPSRYAVSTSPALHQNIRRTLLSRQK